MNWHDNVRPTHGFSAMDAFTRIVQRYGRRGECSAAQAVPDRESLAEKRFSHR